MDGNVDMKSGLASKIRWSSEGLVSYGTDIELIELRP